MEKNVRNLKTAVTHAGSFHADDVFSAAFLRILNPYLTVKRVLSVEGINDDDETIIFDIGGGRYDHHQCNAEVRENGVKYAAFGLLWRDYGNLLISEKGVKYIDETFIQKIDHADNFGGDSEMCRIVGAMNPTWDEPRDINIMYGCFMEAVDWAQKVLKRIIKEYNSAERAMVSVEDALNDSDGDVVVLSKNMPWDRILIPSTARFVVYPSNRGEYNAQVVPVKLGEHTAKLDFPKEWGGLRNEKLEDVSGIEGLLFCHSSLFLCAADTKQAAIAACRKAIRLSEEQR